MKKMWPLSSRGGGKGVAGQLNNNFFCGFPKQSLCLPVHWILASPLVLVGIMVLLLDGNSEHVAHV